MTHHDLVIIGSGSGNSLVTPDFADTSVAIIESNPTFGGTCLNVGCIPTKMYVRSAEIVATVAEGARLGVDAHVDAVHWHAIRDRIFGRIDPIAAGGKEYRRTGGNTTLYEGRAAFSGERTLTVTAADGSVTTVTGDNVVIATGSHPHLPGPFPAAIAAGLPVHTSDTVMRLADLPERMLVVGGGYIAVEFAHVFDSLGTEVTLVNRSSTLLRQVDEEVCAHFSTQVVDKWNVRFQSIVTALEPADGATSAGPRVRAHLDDGSTIDVDVVLVATGRHPSTGDLGATAGGVRLDPDGRVVVDEHGRTSAAGVWALGDVTAPLRLKHVANQHARVVAHNIAHPDDLRSLAHRYIPAAVFSHPEIAMVGLTEAQARAAGHDVTVKVQSYGDTAYGWALEDTQSICKLVADRSTGRLLGAHLVGPVASTLIQPLIQAMEFDQHVHDVARGQYWIHPALSEVVENALLGLDVAPGSRLDPS